MNRYIELVEEFHRSFDHPIEETIKEDNLMLRKLRLKLLYEEIEELSEAMGTDSTLHELCKETLNKPIKTGYDKVETLDAICDIQYILSGTKISLGYKNIFDDAFDEVHRSNMSKMCLNRQQAEDTIEYYKNEKRESLQIDMIEKNGKYIILREDGKILKNKYYSSPNLFQFIQE